MRVPWTPYNYINWQYWASVVLAFKGPDKEPRALSGEILDKSDWDASVSKLVSREIFNAWLVKILVFPSSTGYMMYSFDFSLSIWGIFYRFMFVVPSRSAYMLISFGFPSSTSFHSNIDSSWIIIGLHKSLDHELAIFQAPLTYP
jgi:hypothetical protein